MFNMFLLIFVKKKNLLTAFRLSLEKDSLRLVVIVPDEQGDSCDNYDKFDGYDNDVLHNGNGFIS
jgi:hypothetical protein